MHLEGAITFSDQDRDVVVVEIGRGQVQRGSEADWFPVDFLAYYDRSQIRAFACVRRKDGVDIPDGEYDVREGEDERRRKWKKWNGEWQVKWRQRWSRKGR